MLPPTDVIRADFDRIAAALADPARPERGDRGDRGERLEPAAAALLAAIPRRRCRVLEVGCGTGAAARALAARGAKVTAIDLSPRMIDVARLRTDDALGIEYRVGDFLAWAPRGFDVAISIATLHHLPLADALARMAEAVVPGGLVLVADLFTAPGVANLPYNAVSWLATRGRPRGSAELAAAWAAHDPHDHVLRLSEVRAVAARTLPGAQVRRRLGWRYTLAWRRPR